MKFGKGFGLITFTALLLALLIFSISITPQYISDTDASTYVIVPMLMLPIFAIFMFKNSEKSVPKVDTQSIVIGTILFTLFIILILDTRASLGPLFFSYRMDMLLLPIAIVALATLVFGLKNLDRFAWIAIYALSASPLLLLPIINTNLNFASVNSLGIYYATRTFFQGMTFVSPITLAYNGYQVSVGNSCIGVGALIALVLFMLPIAYFLDGSRRKKALWILSGLGLMLLLNFIRMLVITVAWFAYGPNQNILDIHAVVGQVIFYFVIIVMIITAGRYKLTYPKIRLGRKRHNYSTAAVAIAVFFSIIYLLISASYSNSQIVSLTSISQNATLNWRSVNLIYSSFLNYQGITYSTIGYGNRSVAINLINSSNKNEQMVALFGQNSTGLPKIFNYGVGTRNWKEYMDGGRIAYLYQFNTTPNTFVYYSSVVYPQGQNNYLFEMYIVNQDYTSSGSSCLSAYDIFYDTIANMAEFNPNAFNFGIDKGYCTVSRVVK